MNCFTCSPQNFSKTILDATFGAISWETKATGNCNKLYQLTSSAIDRERKNHTELVNSSLTLQKEAKKFKNDAKKHFEVSEKLQIVNEKLATVQSRINCLEQVCEAASLIVQKRDVSAWSDADFDRNMTNEEIVELVDQFRKSKIQKEPPKGLTMQRGSATYQTGGN